MVIKSIIYIYNKIKKLIDWKINHVRKHPVRCCVVEFFKGLAVGLFIYHYFLK